MASPLVLFSARSPSPLSPRLLPRFCWRGGRGACPPTSPPGTSTSTSAAALIGAFFPGSNDRALFQGGRWSALPAH
eukprot:8184216-Pyramimonas_sp.AAC.1